MTHLRTIIIAAVPIIIAALLAIVHVKAADPASVMAIKGTFNGRNYCYDIETDSIELSQNATGSLEGTVTGDHPGDGHVKVTFNGKGQASVVSARGRKMLVKNAAIENVFK